VSEHRERQQRSISRATKGIAIASVAATAVFGLAAAHTGKSALRSSGTADGSTASDDGTASSVDDDLSSPSLAPSQSAPSQHLPGPVSW
jgi:hypothetical protein